MYKGQVKCKESRPVFEIVSPFLFSTTMTVTLCFMTRGHSFLSRTEKYTATFANNTDSYTLYTETLFCVLLLWLETELHIMEGVSNIFIAPEGGQLLMNSTVPLFQLQAQNNFKCSNIFILLYAIKYSMCLILENMTYKHNLFIA